MQTHAGGEKFHGVSTAAVACVSVSDLTAASAVFHAFAIAFFRSSRVSRPAPFSAVSSVVIFPFVAPTAQLRMVSAMWATSSLGVRMSRIGRVSILSAARTSMARRVMLFTTRISSHNVRIYERIILGLLCRSAGSPASVGRGYVLVVDVERDHESVGALVLECLVAEMIGLDGVGHEHEAVVPLGAPVLEVVDDYRCLGVAGEALQLDLGDLAAVHLGGGGVPRVVPLDRRVRAHRERVPLDRVDVAHDLLDAFALGRRY